MIYGKAGRHEGGPYGYLLIRPTNNRLLPIFFADERQAEGILQGDAVTG